MDTTATELAYRQSAGIAVALFWNRPTGELTIKVADHASGEILELPIASEQAPDAFHHAYAYANRTRPYEPVIRETGGNVGDDARPRYPSRAAWRAG